MAKFHFVEDYERLVSDLIASHPLNDAMELAVGGRYELIGVIEKNILKHVGLRDGMAVFDLGCGSGRLAWALGQEFQIEYCGADLVPALLDYARTKSPKNYRFLVNHSFKIPSDTGTVDIASAFSVFTHLLPQETYLYLEEMHRVLKSGGHLVCSFLEFSEPDHWPVFQSTVEGQRHQTNPHLNTFLERSALKLWAEKLGYETPAFIDSAAAPYGGHALGQSIAILRKPVPPGEERQSTAPMPHLARQ